MGLATALFTSMTGMETNSEMLSIAGNNISNINTTAFKRSQMTFETQISQTMRNGSAPSAQLGGSNPAQVGLGVRMSSIRQDFSGGSLTATGVNTDMALEGNGYFIVDLNGERRFTRDGGFSLDRDFNLTKPGGGGLVQGYGIDEDFNVVEGVLTNVNIPIGLLTVAKETSEVRFAGNLNAGGDIATLGSIVSTEELYSDAGATTFADGATALDSVFDVDGNQLFATNDTITITGASKGGAVIEDRVFGVGAGLTGVDAEGTTVQEMMDFLDEVFGIDTTLSGGVTITNGVIDIESNTGTANTIRLENGNFIKNADTSPETPVIFSETQDADGESVRTSFIAYDSLGNTLTIDLTLVLEDKDDSGTTWRVYAQSDDDSDLDRALGTSIATFDTDGQLVNITDPSFVIDRDNTGAGTPQSIEIVLDQPEGAVTSLFDVTSQFNSLSQDGLPIGTLEDFTVSQDGTLTGVFSNSALRTLGRIPVAVFANNEGLEDMGGNLFRAGVNSGDPVIVTATTGGSGQIVGRALELSNVDLAEEFINIINASTGFSANSRVLSTSDRLIQELLATVR